MNNIFYVYVYRNPLKDNEPFYVGKGKDNRKYYHLNEKLTSSTNRHKYYTIAKIKKNGLEPIIETVLENISEEEAFEKEKELIALFGRKDLGKGPLTNMNNGGEGSSGLLNSEETKRKKSIAASGKNNSMYGTVRKHTTETLNKISKSLTGKKNPMWNKEHSIKTKKKISESLKGENHPNYGKKRNSEFCEKIRGPRGPMKKIKCPNCGLEGGISNMKGRHIPKCMGEL